MKARFLYGDSLENSFDIPLKGVPKTILLRNVVPENTKLGEGFPDWSYQVVEDLEND